MQLDHAHSQTEVGIGVIGGKGQGDIVGRIVLDVILIVREEKRPSGGPVIAIGEVVHQGIGRHLRIVQVWRCYHRSAW